MLKLKYVKCNRQNNNIFIIYSEHNILVNYLTNHPYNLFAPSTTLVILANRIFKPHLINRMVDDSLLK